MDEIFGEMYSTERNVFSSTSFPHNCESILQTGRKSALDQRAAFVLIVVLFFTWGFLTSLNDVLVADLRSIFHLSYRSATLVQFTFFSSCFFFSFPSSRLVTSVGYKLTMIVGLIIMCLGALCFVHASGVTTFGFFLFALSVMAGGSTALQTAAGPYVSFLGTEESASSRFSIALGINSLGAMLAPGFGATFILHDVHLSSASQAASLRLPYLGIAVALLCVALVLLGARLPPIRTPASSIDTSIELASYRGLLRHPKLLFGVVAMLLYVGAEISIGSLLINFLGQADTSALAPRQAALLASLYGGGMMIGRCLAPLVLGRYRPQRVLSLAAALAVFLVLTSIVSAGKVASFSLIAVGLCNSIMVPVIFTTAISGLGALTAKGSGLLVAALVGGALIPVGQGTVADHIGLHRSFLVPAACYVAIFAYGRYSDGVSSAIPTGTS